MAINYNNSCCCSSWFKPCTWQGYTWCGKLDCNRSSSPEDQARIFERFVQVDSTSTRKYNGSGLGLALVREYGDMQGFAVSVESELGRGSRFVITIPASAIVGEIEGEDDV